MYIETPYISISEVISSHMGSIYWDTRYYYQELTVTWVICILRHPILLLVKLLVVTWVPYIETPNIIIHKVINSHMGSINIETPHIIINK